jgi:Asp-tRNA(Asn)/Glu-tRNA(Gln) amidotransferase B subunit
MRSKEDAPDYRYFPDPDLLEVNLEDDLVARIKTDCRNCPTSGSSGSWMNTVFQRTMR